MTTLRQSKKKLMVAGVYLALFSFQTVAAVPDLSGHSGGVVVHVGCGNGSLLRQFRTNEAFFTIGLDTNAANVATLRTTLRDEGCGGQVLVDEWNGTDLPFINNFVNALILENPCNVSSTEVARVLVPNGVVYRLQGTNWVTEVKPWPATMDEWTHGAHGPDNNPCSHDTEVGPLRRMQWYTGPFWAKYHFSSPVVHFMLSGGGRLFYVVDDSPTSTLGGGFPERWTLIVRDAFNGKLLWSKPMSSQWGMAMYAFNSFWAAEIADLGNLQGFERRFVVDGNRLYGTMGWNDPIVAMDAATGSNLWTSAGTGGCRELYAANGRLYLRCSTDPELIVLDANTGATLWTNSTYNPSFIAIRDNQLCMRNSSGVVALNATNYVQQWISSSNPGAPSGYQPWLIHGGPVVFARNKEVTWHAYSAATGQELWTHTIPAVSIPVSGVNNRINQRNLFVSNNRAWTYTSDIEFSGLNLLTGAKEVPINVKNVTWAQHHHRCVYDVATDRFFINSQQNMEMVELSSTGTNQIHNWVRSSCHAGFVPANGLIYDTPASCQCQASAMIHGIYGLAADAAPAGRTFTSGNRLTTGPAFGAVTGYAPATNDWAQFRYDSKRKSATAVFVPKKLQPMWNTSLGGELTAPVIAGGRVFVANKTDHTVRALDATSGAKLWTYAAGGVVDTPPSVWGDCVIFGCGDGRVYCLRAADGALVWRFQAAPRDCRNMQLEDVSSVWALHGSVLVENGRVYVSAGHSSRLDGGIWLYALNATNGAVLATNQVMHVSPAVPAPTNDDNAFDREGLKNDLMVSDGSNLFMRELVLTSNLVSTTSSRTDHLRDNLNTLLDSSWNQRTKQLYNKSTSGQYLCVDTQNVYGIKAYSDASLGKYLSYAPGSGYILFAQGVTIDGNTPLPEPGVQNALLPAPSAEHLWWKRVPLRVQAMMRAGDYLFIAGQPDVFNRADPFAAFEGRAGGSLWTVSPTNGERLADYTLTSPPVYDGMAAANNRLFISTMDGRVLCLGQPETAPAASASVQPSKGTTSTVFTFDGTGSQDPDGRIVAYEWAVNGTVVSTNALYTSSFGSVGGRTVQLAVRDDDGMKGFDTAALSVTSPGTDSDNDGLPDAWEMAKAGNLSMNAADDTDGDDLTALQEYVYGTNPFAKDSDSDGLADNLEIMAGTDPSSADSILQINGQPLSGNRMQITWDSVPNRTYSIWGSTNLAGGLTELVAHHIAATPPVNTFTDTATHNGSYFYQLQVTQNNPVPPQNSAPSANNDDAFTTTNKAVAVSVLANDSDADFQSLTVTGVTQGAHGAVLFSATNVTYTPQAGWTGGTDTFSYVVGDSIGLTASGQVTVYVKSGTNLVIDPLMKKAHLEIATITTAEAGAGWYIGTKPAWWWDRNKEWNYAFCGTETGLQRAMAQIIYNNSATKGTGTVQFRATHQGTNDTLKVKVYGAGSFSQAMNSETGSGTLLYDSGNIAGTECGWQNYSGAVNFGTGYGYYLVLVWTDGIAPGTGEFMAVDTFYLGL